MTELLKHYPESAKKYPDIENNPESRGKLWQEIAPLLCRDYPNNFSMHLNIYKEIFEQDETPLAWIPSQETIANSNAGKLLQKYNCSSFKELHKWSVQNRREYWKEVIEQTNIQFDTSPHAILENEEDPENTSWLPGSYFNMTDSCFQQAQEHPALIHQSEMSAEQESISYEELEKMVNRVASGLVNQGYQEEDRIVLYMPLSCEAIAAYLGIIKAGMTVVSVADSFSPQELARRIQITNAKGVITCEGYSYSSKILHIYSKVKQADAPHTIVIPYLNQLRLRPNDIWWNDFLGSDAFTSVKKGPEHCINILFSSGTTKEPKAIPWTQHTPIKAAADGRFHHDIQPDDVVTWTTGMGWMMGPWLIFATLINRATLAVFTGAAAGEKFGRFTEKSGITILGTIPSLVKNWRKSGIMEQFNWSVRAFSSTGEPSGAEDYFYLMYLSGYNAPIIEYCGGTEIGGGYITGSLLQPASPATFTTPALGIDFYLLNKNQQPAGENETGEAYLTPPSMGLSQYLLNRDHHEEYFEGCPKGPGNEILRRHGDAFYYTNAPGTNIGFYISQGRIDDTMNLGGVKIGSVEIEEILNQHPDIFETAAIAIPDEAGGPEKLIIYYVPGKEFQTESVKDAFQEMINEQLNPLFRIKDTKSIEHLPRTASNKVMRRKLREWYLEERNRES